MVSYIYVYGISCWVDNTSNLRHSIYTRILKKGHDRNLILEPIHHSMILFYEWIYTRSKSWRGHILTRSVWVSLNGI